MVLHTTADVFPSELWKRFLGALAHPDHQWMCSVNRGRSVRELRRTTSTKRFFRTKQDKLYYDSETGAWLRNPAIGLNNSCFRTQEEYLCVSVSNQNTCHTGLSGEGDSLLRQWPKHRTNHVCQFMSAFCPDLIKSSRGLKRLQMQKATVLSGVAGGRGGGAFYM